jgi:hypothetical protein
VSEERDVRAYEMGRLKSDDSNLKEGIGFKMESLKYRADTSLVEAQTLRFGGGWYTRRL